MGSRMARPINMKHSLTCSHCGQPMISVNVSTGTCWECSFPRG
jgi:ribosomal protein L37E